MLAVIRHIIWIMWFICAAIMVLPLCVMRPFNAANGRVFTTILSPLSFLIYNFEQENRGLDKFHRYQGKIIVSNHQENQDMIVFGSVISDNMITVGKKQMKMIPIFGWVYWLSDHLFIDRANRKKALETLDLAKHKLITKGYNLWILAEGTRSRGRGFQKFKKGAFHIAVQTGCPIVPVITSSFHKCLNFNRWNAGKIIVEVLDPISVDGLTEKDIPQLMDKVWNVMNDGINRLDRELAQEPRESKQGDVKNEVKPG